MNKMKNVVDKYFDFISQLGGPSFIEDLIPTSMIDKSKSSNHEGISFWKPISSTISNEDILQLERFFKAEFPTSFKSFLQYKHFIELKLGANSISFFKNLPGTFIEDTISEYKDFYADVIGKNFIPFARMGDHGVLCFDTNNMELTSDYEVVSFDLSDGQVKPKKYAPNFLTMFDEFENHLNDWMKNSKAK